MSDRRYCAKCNRQVWPVEKKEEDKTCPLCDTAIHKKTTTKKKKEEEAE